MNYQCRHEYNSLVILLFQNLINEARSSCNVTANRCVHVGSLSRIVDETVIECIVDGFIKSKKKMCRIVRGPGQEKRHQNAQIGAEDDCTLSVHQTTVWYRFWKLHSVFQLHQYQLRQFCDSIFHEVFPLGAICHRERLVSQWIYVKGWMLKFSFQTRIYLVCPRNQYQYLRAKRKWLLGL